MFIKADTVKVLLGAFADDDEKLEAAMADGFIRIDANGRPLAGGRASAGDVVHAAGEGARSSCYCKPLMGLNLVISKIVRRGISV